MKYIYYVYQLIIALPICLVATLLTGLFTVVGCYLGNAHFWGYYPGRIWSKVMCRVLLLPIHVEGKEKLDPHTSYVFVANHQGAYDIFLLYGYLDFNFKWMMKKALRNMPVIGKACVASNQIFVDKSGPKKIQQTYDAARETLQHGTSLMVFPEGARTFTGHMGLFRKGAFQLAQELQLPVVPITIDGSFDVKPRMQDVYFVHHHSLRLVIHDPIPPTGDKSTEALKQLTQQAYDIIMADLPERHQGYVKNDDQ